MDSDFIDIDLDAGETEDAPVTDAEFRRLMELRVERDETKLAADNAEKAYRAFEAEIWDRLSESSQLPPYKFDLGEPHGVVTFHPKETHYGRIIDKEKALDYFEGRAMMDEVTEPKIVMARVNEIVRDAMEQNESLPEGIDFYARRFITITKAK
jgi:hypothetical protein